MGAFRAGCFQWLLAAVAALFPAVIVDARLYIDYLNNGRDVSQGTTAAFECYSSSIPQNVFQTGGRVEFGRTRVSATDEIVARWSRIDHVDSHQILVSNTDNRFAIEGGIDNDGTLTLTLTIRLVDKYDQAASQGGGYFCTVSNSTGLIVRATPIPLTVRYPPADHYPVCTAMPEEDGEEVKLTCVSEKTTPQVSLQWYKDDVRVSDTQDTNFQTKSEYLVRADELSSRFECRLVYVDGDDVEVRRSCKFSRPYIAIKKGLDLSSGQTEYYAFAHSSPPFVSNLSCSVQTPKKAAYHFDQMFPFFGVMTVGPVDNGTELSCQAKNVLGWSDYRIPINATPGMAGGGTTLPPAESRPTLRASVWPANPVVTHGGNVTFVCSYSLVVHAAPRARVDIEWKFNDVFISTSKSRFEVDGNVLHVISYIPPPIGGSVRGDGDTVTCVASVWVDETRIVNIPRQEVVAVIGVGPAAGSQCGPSFGQSSQPGEAQSMTPFIIGVCVLVVTLIFIMFILLVVFFKRNKQSVMSQSVPEQLPRPSMTYPSEPSNPALTRAMSLGGQTVVQRALPAQPEPAAMTTLRSVVTTPASPPAIAAAADPLRKLGSVSSCTTADTTATDLPYQSMVGDTGIISSRHGSISSNALRPDLHHPKGQVSRLLSFPDHLVPGPNGGFMPLDAATSGARRPTNNRSMSDGTQSADTDEEVGYEDPDAVRQRRRLRRTVSNDYYTGQGPTMATIPTGWKAVQFSSHYANDSTGDDSVFLPPI